MDGTNHMIWIHDRKNGNLVGSIGGLGRMAGQFFWIDAIAMDSHGNLYTAKSGPASAARVRPHGRRRR